MSSELVGVFGILALIVLIMLRVHISIALGVVGVVGYAMLDGWHTALIVLGTTPFDLTAGYALSVMPLFILMGIIAGHSGMSRELFESANALFSGRRGALAMGTIGACAGFGAICGSSLATAATMSRIAVPEMQRLGYDTRLSAGSVAVGGTLGILIPPSVMLVIYAVVAEQSVPHLFAAALFPGLALAALQIGVVWAIAKIAPHWTPESASVPWRARLRAMTGMWKLLFLFFLAVGGIYLGWFSPTEAAAIASFGAIVLAALSRQMSWRTLIDSLVETARTAAMLFFILITAFLFAFFLVRTQLPAGLVTWVQSIGMAPWMVIVAMVAFYIVLGCVLESIAMMLITVPVFLPLILKIGYDPVWFGVLLVVVIEVGLVTPPVGLNIFVIRAQLPDISLSTIYRGIVPFLGAAVVLIALLMIVPELALWLPHAIY
jgi:C4-dicarboxylate transporter DctM subunit